MSHILVFDIETVPDVASGRRLHDLEGLNDADAASAMLAMRRQENGTDFLRLPLHKVVAISLVLRETSGALKVRSLGSEDSDEKTLIEQFYKGLEYYSPQLVSWNGGGFDLPVLNYRALLHGISAPRFWETGDNDRSFRFDNYINRFHSRHLDLMDVLAMHNGRAVAPLDQVATMLGFPGKMGMSGGKVLESIQQGNLREVRDYCETDVLNTYLVFLRYQLIKGDVDNAGYELEINRLKDYLKAQDKPHFTQFLEAWS